MNRLGELERAVMDVLWAQNEPMTVREVGKALDERDLAHTTVMTVLDRLAKKKVVDRAREGRAWRYSPAASRENSVSELMFDALGEAGDRDAALAAFVQSMDGQEAEALRRALAEIEQPRN